MKHHIGADGPSKRHLSRRSFLMTASVAGLAATTTGPEAYAATDTTESLATPSTPSMFAPEVAVAANGWPLLDELPQEARDDLLASHPIPGTGVNVVLRVGAPAALLLYVAQRFHYEISPLSADRAPVIIGYRTRPVGVDMDALPAGDSTQASGTALDIRPDFYPRGTRGGFGPSELLVVRDVLARYPGLIRWGGDSVDDPDESHFEIAAAPDDPALLGAVIPLFFDNPPVDAPGSDPDAPFRPVRRSAASEVGRRARSESRAATQRWHTTRRQQ